MRLRSATLILWFILCLIACEPASMPLPVTVTPFTDFLITTTNMGGVGVPAGSSTSFTITLNFPSDKPPESAIWKTPYIATGLTTTIVGGVTPWQQRLIVTADPTLAAGSYTVGVAATTNSNQVVLTTIKVDVMACTETPSGSSTEAINSNLVELITAGKPNVEHGLLVPIQICDSGKHIQVKFTSAIGEDGAPMSTQPRFYIFRSEVWPAPTNITAHPLAEYMNVQVPIIAQASSAGVLDADVGAGLYLLIFERDRFGTTLTPQTTPASVTFDLKIS